jgi:ABC-2 type transport system permease protein
MSFQPGSAAWLLRHEVRLSWREFLGSAVDGHRRRKLWIISIFVSLFAIAQLGSLALVGILSATSAGTNFLGPRMISWGGLIFLVLFSLMLMHALNSIVRTIFARGDLNLLLCAPIPARRVLAVRAVVIALTGAILPALFMMPLVNALIIFGYFRWAAVYLVLLALGSLSVAAALLMARALVAILGPDRTQKFAQVVAAVIGASLAITGQVAQALTDAEAWTSIEAQEKARLSVGEIVRWPVLALVGEPVPSLSFLALSLAALCATIVFSGDWFARAGALASAGRRSTRVAPRLRSIPRVAAHQVSALRRKEWLLLKRDPWLISQALFPLLYLIPIAVVLWRSMQQSSLLLLTPLLVMISAQLAGALTWISISGEEAPELVGSAPIEPHKRTLAKIQVVSLIVVAILLGPLIALGSRSLWVAGCALIGCAGAAASEMLVQLWFPTPGARRSFRTRRAPSKLAAVVELGLSLLWGLAALLAAMESVWAIIPICLGLWLLWGLYPRAIGGASHS